MPEIENPQLKKLLKPLGELNRPVPAGTAFGVLPPESDMPQADDDSNLPYPPLVENDPGCVFDPESRTLTSNVWGMVRFTPEGLLVEPCWSLSDDKAMLLLEIHHEDCKGKPVTIDRLLKQLPAEFAEAELKLDIKAIELGLRQSGKTGRCATAVVASGKPTEPGRDGRLELNFSADQTVGTVREDGSMDFRERAGLHSVAENQELGRLFPPVQGKEGRDIFGNPVQPPPARELKINIGQGVKGEANQDGITTFTASRPGVVHYRNQTIEVSEMVEIKGDIDYETGNVRADHGSIHIRGDVKSGFKVESKGDVIVDGLIESADVTAGGIVVAGGVIMNGTNRIVAQGDVGAKFFRNAFVKAGGNVTAQEEIASCKIMAGGEVTVLGAKGSISGGRVVSGTGIHASNIGNKAQVKTIVEIRLQTSRGHKLNTARAQLSGELERLDKAIGSDDALQSLMKAPDEDRRILAEMIKVRGKIQADIRGLKESIGAEQRRVEELLVEKIIKADTKVFRGTEVIIGGKRLIPDQDLEGTAFFFDPRDRRVVSS